MKIVLASNNAGKVREFKSLLQNLKLDVIPQAELGVPEIEETGLTFVENAIIKARHAAKLTGLPALADDSGLVVPALQGAPGIYSSRFAGLDATSKNNIEKLLKDMQSIPNEERHAHFYCVLVFMLHEKDPAPLICDGKWNGIILDKTQGEEGFGYDPIFYVPSENKTAAELPLTTKNTLSHRGNALQTLLKRLPEKL